MRKKLRQMTAISVELCERDAAWERATMAEIVALYWF